MTDSLENRLSDLYIANFGRITEGWPASVNSRRREALETIALSGIPGSGEEAYRHFDLGGFLEKAVAFAEPAADAGSGGYPSFDNVVDGRLKGTDAVILDNALHIIVDNGICSLREIEELPGGILYGSLRMAAGAMPELVGQYMDKAVGCHADSVTALCSAFAGDGAFVYVPECRAAGKPFHIDIRFHAGHEGTACFPRVLVIVGKGASAEVVMTYTDSGTCGIVGGHLREFIVGEGARLDVTEAVSMRPDSVLVSCNYTLQDALSQTAATAVWLRGGATRVNAVTALAGREAESSLYGLYMGNGGELCDINMKVLHDVPDCRSNEVIKGIVSGNATGSFTGMVYVAPDAQRTAALQQSRNLQLSDTSRIFTEPQLEIYADDVKCSHGATVGQLNEEEVYYMRQRGISEQDAKKLQLQGFVNDVISHCTSEEACAAITALAENRITEL